MFQDKKNNNSQVLVRNIIGKNTSIKGDIVSDGDFRIDGTIEGTIKTNGRVVIGKEGEIKGTVNCNNADIEGLFTGKLIVNKLLTLKPTAQINGETTIGKLAIEPGAIFNATCTMKTGVKELQNNDKKTSEKTA